MGSAYQIAKTTDKVKKINFYTSTSFEGCDIYDKNGRTAIVSDGKQEHTLIDFSTQFIQICGRIRNSNYNSNILHIFSSSLKSDVTIDEFKERTNKDIEDTEKMIISINNMSLDTRETFCSNVFINNRYIGMDDNNLYIDYDMVNFDIYKFNNMLIYNSGQAICEEFKQCGLDVNIHPYLLIDSTVNKFINSSTAKVSFKDAYTEYLKLKANPDIFTMGETPISILEKNYPLVKDVYEKLTPETVEKLKYHVGNIKRELIKEMDTTTIYKVVKACNDKFPKQTAILVSKIKEELQSIYDLLNIKRTAKATDISQWYEIKQNKKVIKGKEVTCITIIRDKLIRVQK